MKPRRKKIYAALIALGLVAVVVDRLLGPGASDATGAARAADAAPRATGPAGLALADSARVEAAPFPRNMPAPPTPEPARDPFAPPRQQPQEPREPGDAGPDGELPGLSAASVTFARSHRLSAVLAGGDAGIVILDDQLLRIGQSVQECTLTHVENAEATFQCFDGPVILRVDTQSGETP
ncbi:MAG: hypothetical protein JXB13_18255 [Phycisphaerae bacterium]|nr:hypothetical protein [Phycisphaerae bacterium]